MILSSIVIGLSLVVPSSPLFTGIRVVLLNESSLSRIGSSVNPVRDDSKYELVHIPKP